MSDYKLWYNEETGEYQNYFYKYYKENKEKVLEYKRKNNWKHSIRMRQRRYEYYCLLVENSYDISFDSLIPYETPFVSFLKRYGWLYEMEYKDDQYIYSFNPLIMDSQKEKEFKEKLQDLIDNRAKKNMTQYENSRNNK